MGIDGNKISFFFSQEFIHYAQIPSYADTAISLVLALKRMVVKRGVKGISEKNVSLLLESFLFSRTEFFVLFFEIPMKNNSHKESR